MLFDTREFPIVRFAADAPLAADAEAQLEALLNRDQRFVLVARKPGEVPPETGQDRRRRALILKAAKARLRRLCAAMIIVEGSTPTPAPFRLAAAAVGKAFGLPFVFVADDAAATAEARRRLASLADGPGPAQPSRT
jgi:hypothetical protein